jgi:hypothetical protein
MLRSRVQPKLLKQLVQFPVARGTPFKASLKASVNESHSWRPLGCSLICILLSYFHAWKYEEGGWTFTVQPYKYGCIRESYMSYVVA